MLKPEVKFNLALAKKSMKLQLRRLESRIDRVVDEQQEDARVAVARLKRALEEVRLLCRTMRGTFDLNGRSGATATTRTGRVSSVARTARAAGRGRSLARSRRGR